MTGDPLDKLRKDSESAGLSGSENNCVLPEAFVEAWRRDYDLETAQAVSFVQLLFSGNIAIVA
jgi:hypothetical protein